MARCLKYGWLLEIISFCVAVSVATAAGWFIILGLAEKPVPDSQNLLAIMRQSILFAAGHGMGKVDCTDEDFPELELFVSGEINAIPPEAFPEQCSSGYAPDPFVKMHTHLFYFVGLFFRFLGISVRTFHIACLFLFALTIAASYCLFRVAVGPVLASLGAVFVACSPAFLVMLPSLRDFGKTPFILLAFFMMAVLIRKSLPAKRFIVLSALLGGVIGLGYGFRQDLLVCLPPALLIILLGPQCLLRWRIAAALSMGMSFLFVAFPVLMAGRSASGATFAHTLIQGSMRHPEDCLGLHGIDYDFGYKTFDPYVIATINAYAQRSDAPYPAIYMTEEYGNAGRDMFRELAVTFPGDVFKRGLLAVGRLAGIFNDDYIARVVLESKMPDYHGPEILLFWGWQESCARHLARYGIFYVVLAIAAVAAVNVRKAFLFVFLLFYFGAYPSLLYEFRHYFYLAVIPLLCIGIIVTVCLKTFALLIRTYKHKNSFCLTVQDIAWRGVKGITFVTVLIAGMVALLTTLNAIQKNRVAQLLSLYEQIELNPLEYDVSYANEKVTVHLKESDATTSGDMPLEISHVAPRYLAIRFAETHRAVTFHLLNENIAFVRPCTVVLRGGGTYYFPVYDFGWDEPALFNGIEMDAWDYECVEHISQAAHIPDDLRVWPYIHIPDDKTAFLHYKASWLDAIVEVARIELASGFGYHRDEAVARYAGALWRFQDSRLFVARALHHAQLTESMEREVELMYAVGAYVNEQRQMAAQWFMEHAQNAAKRHDYEEAKRLSELGMAFAPYDLRYLEIIYDQMDDKDAARNIFERALRQIPEAHYTAAKLDALYQKHYDAQTALTFFQSLAVNYPDASTPLFYAGLVMERLDDDAAAAVSYERAIQLKPDYAHALYRLGALRILTGEMETGIELIREAHQSDFRLANIISERCGEIAAVYMLREEYETAKMLSNLALEIAPDDLWHWVRLGEISERQGDIDNAVDVYLSVLIQAPESPVTAEKLTNLMRQGKMTTESLIRKWTRVVAQHPAAAIPQIHLGIALEAAGDIEGAMAAYQNVLLLHPDAEIPRERLEMLQRPNRQ